MSAKRNLIGQTFGRLTVIKEAGRNRVSHIQWLCECTCGTSKVILGGNLRAGRTKSCGCLQREISSKIMSERIRNTGPRHHNWKGGRFQSNHGYVFILDRQHENSNHLGYVLEHVKVMSKIIGRPMLPKETIHHKNGIRNDNRPENLELWASSHPPGQRIEDLLTYAREILEKYEATSFIS